jgi:antitoxin component of MazEF toxin-antitoxin module
MKVHTSTAELKTKDTGASLVLGPRTSSLLPDHGFQAGGDVLVRLTREKIEIRPIRGKKDLQEQVRELTEDVSLLEDRLQSMIATLPEVPDAMAAHRIPFSLEADLRATLEIVLADDVASAAERLRKAAEVTPEQLQEEWEREHGDRKR